MTDSHKHTSLLLCSNSYGRNFFYSTGSKVANLVDLEVVERKLLGFFSGYQGIPTFTLELKGSIVKWSAIMI